MYTHKQQDFYSYDSLCKPAENGGYFLIFPNKFALDKETIAEIFSEYGSVMSITAAGDERGLRFVRYRTFEEGKEAIDGLRNNDKIKLIPHRPKSEKKDDNKKDKNSYHQKRKSHGFQKNGKLNFKYPIPDKQNGEEKNENNTHFDKDYHLLDDNSANKSNQDHNNDNISVCSFSSYKSFSIQDKESSVNSIIRSNPQNFSPDSSLIDEIPELVCSPKILNRSKRKLLPKKIILNAEEVVVANIGQNFGPAYILHLLEQFDPIAISYPQKMPKSRNSYCHVYFKSVENAIAAETHFDNYDLNGYKLIVMRPCRLMEEATS